MVAGCNPVYLGFDSLQGFQKEKKMLTLLSFLLMNIAQLGFGILLLIHGRTLSFQIGGGVIAGIAIVFIIFNIKLQIKEKQKCLKI